MIVPVTATLALAACSAPDARLAFLIPDAIETATWRGEEVSIHQSLDDPAGLAGIEIEVLGAGQPATFTATDFFVFQGVMATHQIRVPDTGRIRVVVELEQNGRLVAQGAGSWLLEPNADWGVSIHRAPHPPPLGLGYTESASCLERLGCYRRWRFPIRSDAVNYEGEALWVEVSRSEICRHCVY